MIRQPVYWDELKRRRELLASKEAWDLLAQRGYACRLAMTDSVLQVFRLNGPPFTAKITTKEEFWALFWRLMFTPQ